MEIKDNKFFQEVTIRTYEADRRHLIFPHFLLWILEEAAVNHAELMHHSYDDLMQKNLLWALAGFKFKVNRLPQWREKITVSTWPKSATKLFIYRDFEIHSESGDLLVSATSSWFVMDYTLRRPVKVDEFAHHLNESSALSDNLKRSNLPSSESLEPLVAKAKSKVNFDDLDHNGHANNVNYLRYLFSSFGEEFKQLHILKEFEIYFVHELSLCDEVESSIFKIDETEFEEKQRTRSFLHELKKSDGTLSAVAKSSWQKIS